jgi:hypothetical protein
LIAENAFLRQQVIVLKRQTSRPRLTQQDRRLLVLLASKVRGWKDALLLVKPDTLLKWHRAGFRLWWRHKSRGHTRAPRVSAETIALIKEMAVNNRLWGTKRIRGELLKLGIRLNKRTVRLSLPKNPSAHFIRRGVAVQCAFPTPATKGRLCPSQRSSSP